MLQSKLDRSVGLEDLVVMEVLFFCVNQKFGEYSEVFVEEFKFFYMEFKDFFNVGSLIEQLEGLCLLIDEDI